MLDSNWGRLCKWMGQGVDDMQAELTGFAWKLKSVWMTPRGVDLGLETTLDFDWIQTTL